MVQDFLEIQYKWLTEKDWIYCMPKKSCLQNKMHRTLNGKLLKLWVLDKCECVTDQKKNIVLVKLAWFKSWYIGIKYPVHKVCRTWCLPLAKTVFYLLFLILNVHFFTTAFSCVCAFQLTVCLSIYCCLFCLFLFSYNIFNTFFLVKLLVTGLNTIGSGCFIFLILLFYSIYIFFLVCMKIYFTTDPLRK